MLLDAAFDLLGTEGWGGTTVRAVCQAARLNPRYFYESFEDLDALVVAVYDRLVEELGTTVMAAIAEAGDDPRARTRAAIGRVVGFVDEDRRRGRVLYVEALGNEALNRRRIETAHLLVGVVEQGGAELHGRPAEGERIGRIAAALLVGGVGELVVAWLDGRIDVTKEQLVDDAARSWSRSATPPRRSPPPDAGRSAPTRALALRSALPRCSQQAATWAGWRPEIFGRCLHGERVFDILWLFPFGDRQVPFPLEHRVPEEVEHVERAPRCPPGLHVRRALRRDRAARRAARARCRRSSST